MTPTSRSTVDALAENSVPDLDKRAAEISERVQERLSRIQDEERDCTPAENELLWNDRARLSGLMDAIELRSRRDSEIQTRSRQIGDAMAQASGQVDTTRGHSRLTVSGAHLRSHAEAIRTGSTFGAEEELGEVYTRATVTVATDMGSPGAWAAGSIPDPVTLRAFANIPNTPLTGATAQLPSVTLPAGVAGATELAAHNEFDAADVANLSALRYGRWSAVSSFVDEFDQLEVINQAHGVGIARDLNLVDVTAIQTAAGTVTAFSASLLDQNVRAAILKVAAAALVPPEQVVLFGTSAALSVINGYAPASGDDRGSVTTRVFGARVYVFEQATAGNVYCFAPGAFRVFSSRLRSAGVLDPTTGGNKFGQWLHSTPAGVAVVGGAAGVDVVTP